MNKHGRPSTPQPSTRLYCCNLYYWNRFLDSLSFVILMLASKVVMCTSVRKNNNQIVIKYLKQQKETKIQRRSVLFEQLRTNSNLKYIQNNNSSEFKEINQLTLEIDEINKRLDSIQ